MSEITNKSQLTKEVNQYAVRFKKCEMFTINDIAMYYPVMNKTRLKYHLDDMVIAGELKKHGESFYQGIDSRPLEDKVKSLFKTEFVAFDRNEVARIFKLRETIADEVLKQVANEGYIEPCKFMPGKYWLKV